jgi:hypothetical protein
VSLRLKELPSIRIHLPADFRVCIAMLGLELLSVRLCGEAQVVAEPYERNPCEVCGAHTGREAADEFAETASRVKDEGARVSERAMRTGAEMFERNAEAVQHPVQSSAKLASTIAERSADQFGRAFDFAAGGVTERSSRNLEAVVQSGTIMAEMMRRMCMECGDIARGRIERSLERMVALVQSRTPQDIVALQSDIYRDNVETFLSFARRLGENSTRLADEAKRRIGSLGENR